MRALLMLSVAPAIVIFYIIIRQDQEDKDKGFLLGVFFMGVVSVVPAIILETLGSALFFGGGESETISEMLLDYFIVVGISEELSKYFAMRIITWKNFRFNSTYDGVVYGVCSCLGFATLENITYVFSYGGGFGTAITRAFMAVPFHAMCGIIWGYGYGISKYRSVKNQPNVHQPVIIGLIIAILYHGLYDFTLSAFDFAGFAIAIVLVLAGYVIIFGKAKRAAKDDELFYSYLPPFREDVEYRDPMCHFTAECSTL